MKLCTFSESNWVLPSACLFTIATQMFRKKERQINPKSENVYKKVFCMEVSYKNEKKHFQS